MLRSKLLIPALALGFACGAFAQVGTTFCAATANSTGLPASLTGSFGSGTGSGLHLEVQDGVPNQIGYFLVGNEITPGVVISSGLLCLVGTGSAQIYRYNVAGTPQNSVGVFGNRGTLENVVGTSSVGSGFDVPSIIPAGVSLPIMAGDTWNFQLWYRDTAVMSGNSNFSNGLSVTFTPAQQRLGMVLIPSGTFNMGSMASRAPYFASADEQPVHSVSISNDFWMGQYEVTQDEYQTLMGTNPSHISGSQLPVSVVTWDNA
ncbi:MAG: SUMF1/EgtB/PvdO family nonheme iron enzyme, partial [Planctomycetes bacterium]|nr:SUMF1/EgtB/PvdO family nonheme iron enzyme [Planctomycetota bacterium]